MLADSDDLAGRPYRIRTCDTLIKRYKRYVPEREKEIIPDTFLLAI